MKTLHTLPLIFTLTASAAQGQGFNYTVNWRSPSLLTQASTQPNNLINDADILTFGLDAPGFGVQSAPAYSILGSDLGLTRYTACLGHLPTNPCGIDVDAISAGTDSLLVDGTTVNFLGGGIPPLSEVWFSVDEWAQGRGQTGLGATVVTESGLVADASADVFVAYGLGIGPVGPGGAPGRNAGVFDGDGNSSLSTNVYPGLGLVEPNVPGVFPATGDDLNGLDVGTPPGFPSSGMYFSLDPSFADPISPTAVNSGSAAAESKLPGDVLRTAISGAAPTVFASAASLGLDLVVGGGPGSDDLDALVLVENGDGMFQPSQAPYDWTTGTTDMLLFSVRRGSAVIGQPDSIFGVPIEPGDILTTPLSPVMGGLSVFPGIMFAAESLGLRTVRSNGVLFGDDLDAMDFEVRKCFDCNNNGIEDAVDIATGASSDTNGDGVPDECEKARAYGFCPPPVAPCGNSNLTAGCGNSAGPGAELYFMGTTSVSADDLVLVTAGLPANKPGLYYMGGGSVALPFGDGVRAVGNGGMGVFRYGVLNSGASGTFVAGPGIVATSSALFGANGAISAGDTWYLQSWYRDPSGPCAGGFNFSNGMRVEFVL